MFRSRTGGFERATSSRLIIMVVVAMVLLIACANIANLMLARAASRRHELTLRLALGATRFRIARQLLVESLLLACLGAAFGLLFAQWGSRMIVGQLSTPRSTVVLDLTLDWRVVGFTALVAVVTAPPFGVPPALRMRRVDPTRTWASRRTLPAKAVTDWHVASPCRSR